MHPFVRYAATIRHLELPLLIALAAAYFGWFGLPVVQTASESLRMVSAFSSDEAYHTFLIMEAIQRRTPWIELNAYGHLYFNLTLLPLFSLSFIGQVTEQESIILMRLVSLLFGFATTVATFVLARRYFGSLAAWLSALMLSIVPLNFLQMSITSHPDTAQVFFLVIGIYFCCRLAEEPRTKWLVLASASAGMAFGTKYSGAFMLPVIWAIVLGGATVFRVAKPPLSNRAIDKGMTIMRYGILAAGIIAIATGLFITPDIVIRYVTSGSGTYNPSKLTLLNTLRPLSMAIGAAMVLAAAPRFLWRRIAQSRAASSILVRIGITVAVFTLAFVASSPSSLIKLNFVRGLLAMSQQTTFGGWFQSEGIGLSWFGLLASPDLISLPVLVMAGTALALIIVDIVRNGVAKLRGAEAIIAAWVIVYFGILVTRINQPFLHYLLPVIPFVIILAVYPFVWIQKHIGSLTTQKPRTIYTACLILLVGLTQLPAFLPRVSELRNVTLQRETLNPAVQAGRWLAETYPASTRILYDQYSYIPPSFFNAEVTWGGTIERLKALDPDIVVTHQGIAGRYSDVQVGRRYMGGETEFLKIHEYYNSLARQSSGYVLMRDFGGVKIYERQRP